MTFVKKITMETREEEFLFILFLTVDYPFCVFQPYPVQVPRIIRRDGNNAVDKYESFWVAANIAIDDI